MVSAAVRAAAAADAAALVARATEVLDAVADPEIPVISVLELGIVRSIEAEADSTLAVGVSPTYAGCPATAIIKADIRAALERAGFARVRIVEVLSPPWSSEWISAAGRRKLQEYGIAPPPRPAGSGCAPAGEAPALSCPRCGSVDTELISEFGSTPCKALHRCRACLEPFDGFKCI
ncbi:MAG: phenylacetate-CoA oxygenase subunit PaaJ [Gammaproteobacteria bacterium]|nr:phenylacetate-CoA oxygenase subunit PaaJ [Gammaproteobacteria bacterium]